MSGEQNERKKDKYIYEKDNIWNTTHIRRDPSHTNKFKKWKIYIKYINKWKWNK